MILYLGETIKTGPSVSSIYIFEIPKAVKDIYSIAIHYESHVSVYNSYNWFYYVSIK